jgi:predicted flap endonuclease-1-like 5' DNA nuclease
VAVLSIIILLALAALGGYFMGTRRASGPARAATEPAEQPPRDRSVMLDEGIAARNAAGNAGDPFGDEKARVIRSRDAEAASLRRELADRDAARDRLEELAHDRERLFGELAAARAETARYRQLIIDIENNAPPPILSGPAGPDDLKLIVGVGPVLERMLHTLGVTTFRQIARWTDRDIAEFDAKLPEFPGRIVRDQWVTQARALHQSKYGEALDLPRSSG